MTEQYNESGLKERIVKKAWEDVEFKNALLANPKAAIQKELQLNIPEGIEIKVVEETPKSVYLVLPVSPSNAEGKAAEGLQLNAMTYV